MFDYNAQSGAVILPRGGGWSTPQFSFQVVGNQPSPQFSFQPLVFTYAFSASSAGSVIEMW